MHTILYIHGMGGGEDSRIPHLLNNLLDPSEAQVVCRTYDFDPPVGYAQIAAWVQELKPSLVIGESLGTLQALRVRGIPHLFVSPALGAAAQLEKWAPVTRFALGRWYLRRKFPAREGKRQEMKWEYPVLCRYRAHFEAAVASIGPSDYYYAFFGTRDHFMKSGVVRIDLWQKYFGDSFSRYDGSHFMEEEYVESLLLPKIREVLSLQKKAEICTFAE